MAGRSGKAYRLHCALSLQRHLWHTHTGTPAPHPAPLGYPPQLRAQDVLPLPDQLLGNSDGAWHRVSAQYEINPVDITGTALSWPRLGHAAGGRFAYQSAPSSCRIAVNAAHLGGICPFHVVPLSDASKLHRSPLWYVASRAPLWHRSPRSTLLVPPQWQQPASRVGWAPHRGRACRVPPMP